MYAELDICMIDFIALNGLWNLNCKVFMHITSKVDSSQNEDKEMPDEGLDLKINRMKVRDGLFPDRRLKE